MPIISTGGNMLTAPVRLDAVVNPVNCVGVSGAGLAAQMKRRFPRAVETYEDACRRHLVSPGDLVLGPTGEPFPSLVVHLATKAHWRNPSQLAWIDRGLANLRAVVLDPSNAIRAIGVPRVGCGLGGLDWIDVRPLVVRHLGGLSHRVYLFET